MLIANAWQSRSDALSIYRRVLIGLIVFILATLGQTCRSIVLQLLIGKNGYASWWWGKNLANLFDTAPDQKLIVQIKSNGNSLKHVNGASRCDEQRSMAGKNLT